MESNVDANTLENGSNDGVLARVGADDDTDETDGLANNDGEQRLPLLHDGAGENGSPDHTADARESKEANVDGFIIVRWAGEEEGEGGPKAGK